VTPLQRRARPLLGTLVEIGAGGDCAAAAIDAAFDTLAEVQARLSRFEPASDIGRFNALPAGASLRLHPHTRHVLRAARQLQRASAGRFDISLGSGAVAWALRGDRIGKRTAGVRLDLGGIAKGYAIDAATQVLQAHGCSAGWVNAGGDLRTFGAVALTLQLRDERQGGTRAWGRLRDGACATSHYAPGSRSTLAGAAHGQALHLSVLAPCCLWADALTKVAALQADAALLAQFGARACWH
jgi:thiamine biosynthesis lipoprotein